MNLIFNHRGISLKCMPLFLSCMKTIVLSLAVTLCALFSVASYAQRVASLVPSVTQTFMQLGADSLVVARTSYCPASAYGNSIVVGDAMSVNVERIVSVKPDYVITMGMTRPEVIAKLKSFNIKVVEMDTPKSFDEICSQTIQLAKLVGCEDVAKRLVAAERNAVDSIRGKVPLEGGSIFEIGIKPLWVAIPGTYLDDMLKMMGLENVVIQGNGSISREYVVNASPAYIIMSSLYGNAESEKSLWARLLPSAKVAVVDENTACCPTPSNFRVTLQTIVESFR